MARDLKFFYFGYQCPHNAYLLARIKTIAWQESVRLHLFDISNDEEISREYSIFSPTMTIVNDKHRLHGPFTKDRIIAMLEDEDTAPSSYRVNQSSEVVRGGASANHLEIGPSDLRALHKLGGPRPVQGQVGMDIRHA